MTYSDFQKVKGQEHNWRFHSLGNVNRQCPAGGGLRLATGIVNPKALHNNVLKIIKQQ